MQYPDTIETQITENIMRAFSQFSKESIMVLETREYNQIYSHIYECLNELGLNERLKKDYDAVEDYKKGMRNRYQHKVDFLREQFPKGCYTKNKHGDFVGINVILASMVKQLCELHNLENIELFIDSIRDTDKYIEAIYLNGACYQFHLLLKAFFPDSIPFINKNKDHIITHYNGKFYDITGEITGEGYNTLTKSEIERAEKWSFHRTKVLQIGECPFCEEPITIE